MEFIVNSILYDIDLDVYDISFLVVQFMTNDKVNVHKDEQASTI